MKGRIISLLNILILFCSTSVLAQGPLTLKDAVEIAIKNNIEVRQADLELERSKVNLTQSRAARFPSAEGFAFQGINQGRSIDPFTNQFINQRIDFGNYGLNAGLPIFNGFSIHNTIRANSLAYDASKMELQQNKDAITLNVILAYLQVLTNTDLVAQSKNQFELSAKQVERLNLMNEQGAIQPSQYYDLKGEQAGNQLALVNNQNALDAARLLLSQLMNVPYDANLQIERISLDQFSTTYSNTPDEIYQISSSELAIVKAAKLRRESAARAVKAFKGLLYPSLSLNGNLTTNYSSAAFQDIFLNDAEIETKNYVTVNGSRVPVISPIKNFRSEKIGYSDQLDNNLFTSVNLGLRIPLFNGLQTRSRIRIAQITEKNAALIEETTRIQLKQNIEQAYFNMTAAQNRYQTLLEQVAAFAESFRGAEERFNAGAINSVDYLVAKNNLDRANINLINARYDFVLRTKVLDYFQNKPLW